MAIKRKSYKPGQLVKSLVEECDGWGVDYKWVYGIVISDSPSNIHLSKNFYLQVLWLQEYKIVNTRRDNVFSL